MKKNKEELTEVLYNYHQIANHFALNERNRRVLKEKYGEQQMTLNQWEILLKQDKFI